MKKMMPTTTTMTRPVTVLVAALALGGLMAMPTAQAATATTANPSQAPAQVNHWLGLWQGQIGQHRVVLALSVDPNRQRIEGRYFYERYGRDLSLWGPGIDNGSGPGTVIELSECPPDYSSSTEVCEKPSGTMTLRLAKDQAGKTARLEGTWQPRTLEGRRPPPGSLLTLTRVGDYTPTAEAFQDAYEQRRLKGAQPKVTNGGQMGPVAWQNLVDARSGITVPQFTKGASPKALTSINQQLKKGWSERISNALTAVDHDDEVKVAFANARWLAITYSVGAYYPGAAHPINGFSATTYDLGTGQPVDWARWFRFTTPQSQSLDINRRDLLAAQVLKALAAQVAVGAPSEGTGDDHCAQVVLEHYECKGATCASGELMGGRVPGDWQVWPLATGLAVSPDVYSEADRQCRGNEVVLPWKQVRAALMRPQDLP